MRFCNHIKIHRERPGSCGVLHVALDVTGEGIRDVPRILNMPTESSVGRGQIFDSPKDRGVGKAGPAVADGSKGLDTVAGEKLPGSALQRCVSPLTTCKHLIYP